MSVESMVGALRIQGLHPTTKLVLIGIANHDGDGGAWPSVATLATYAGVTERQVQRHIAALVDAGYLSVDSNGGGTHHTRDNYRPNLYHLHLGVTSTARKKIAGVTSKANRGDIGGIPGVTSEASRGVAHVTRNVLEPSKETSGETSADFGEFYVAYPRHVGREAAMKAWKRISADERRLALMALPLHVDLWKREGRGTSVIPYPATWLNGKRWEDEIEFRPSLVQTARTEPKGAGGLRALAARVGA